MFYYCRKSLMLNSPPTQPWRGFWEGWGGFWCSLDFRWWPAFLSRWVSNLDFHYWSVLPQKWKIKKEKMYSHHLSTKPYLPKPIWTATQLFKTISQSKLSLSSLPVSWLPVVRELVGLGLSLLCLCLATSLTLVTIAIGWIAHRPLLGLTLLAAAAVPILLSRRRAQAMNHRKSWKLYL